MVQCVKISVNGSRTLYSQGNWDFLLFEIDPNHAGTPCMLQNVHFWGGSQVERIPSCYFAVWNFLLKGRTNFQILKSKFVHAYLYELHIALEIDGWDWNMNWPIKGCISKVLQILCETSHWLVSREILILKWIRWIFTNFGSPNSAQMRLSIHEFSNV